MGLGCTLDVIGVVPCPIRDLFCREWQREKV